MKRRALIALVIVLAVIGALATRVFVDGRAALAEGDAAVTASDLPTAIARWRRAARWYAPLAPHVEGAYQRLGALATEAEARGDEVTALEAWRAIRSSILATRWVVISRPALLERANGRIAALMARAEGAAADPGKTEPERAAWHLALLARDEAPSVPWTLLALAGLALWIGGGVHLAWRGFTADDRLDLRPAVRAGLCVLVGLVAWGLGLYLA